ncbi:MAG: C25 family cysteine peptidase [bacterium]|nr:C25 family cysteine peptidase [bacterium]
MKKLKFLICGIILFSTQVFALPNLIPKALAGWSAPLVCSIDQDVISEDTLYTGTPYYYSWAITNNGDQNVTSGFYVRIMRNDSIIKSYRLNSLAAGDSINVKCLQSTVSIPGIYNMKLVVDADGEITESSETDNEYSHDYCFIAGQVPDIAVTPDALSYYYHIPDYKYVNCSWTSNEVIVDIDVPAFDIKEISTGAQEVDINGFEQMREPGKPALPFKTVTLAVPPNGIVEGIEVVGNSVTLSGKYNIAPASAVFPLVDNKKLINVCYEEYNNNKKIVYSSNTQYPAVKGELLSTGGLRKYNLATVAIYPVQYNAVTGQLSYASHLQVKVKYRADADKEAEYKRLASDNLAEEEANELIYNRDQVKEWYPSQADKGGTKAPTYDYVIITTNALQQACSTLAGWKSGLGFKTNIVTKEWIAANYTGVDVQQKIRNFLRDKYPTSQWGIKYVLIVGNNVDMPMRTACLFSNNPYPAGMDSLQHPIPTDLYYSDLSNPDNTSWNKDGDGYFGEMLTANGNPGGNDVIDYVSEVYVGRIPWSDATIIRHIIQKIVNFERDTTISYKKKSLLVGAMLYFANEDNSGRTTIDGAQIMENMLTNSVINSSMATTLYEKEGLLQSTYSCDAPITQTNIINNWNGIGIFAEFSHGLYQEFGRKVWSTDDGDGVPESNVAGEITWPIALRVSDVTSLDDDKPAVTFLNSCLNSYPEVEWNMAAGLLDKGSVSVCAATRSAWTGSEVMMYYFFKKLLQDTSVSKCKTGPSFDLAKANYVSFASLSKYVWINLLTVNLYGDPSLYHFGYKTTPCKDGTIWICNRGGAPNDLSVTTITYTAPWIMGLSATSMTLAPGESASVSITIQPTGLAEGVYKDTLRISSNDPDESIYKEPVILTVSTEGVAEINSSVSPVFLNLNACPNPFIKSTIVSYQLSAKSKVSLKLYDVSGREIKTLIEEMQAPGQYKKEIKGLKTGVYFVKLSTKNYNKTAKLIIIK